VPPAKTSLFYFGNIQMRSQEDFSSAFLETSNSEIVKQLLAQAQAISKIRVPPNTLG
jgi:hypothetical protein